MHYEDVDGSWKEIDNSLSVTKEGYEMQIMHLSVDGEEIVTTPTHPFYVKDKGFINAGNLKVGEILVDSEGNELHLRIKRWEQLQYVVPVYNFAVEDYHTYFVGYEKVFVHNMCSLDSAKVYFKKSDIKMVDDAARQVGVDRDLFRTYIHELKHSLSMKASQNFTYQQLLELAEEMLEN